MPPDAPPDDDSLDDEESTGPLHGLLIGSPFAIGPERGLIHRDDAKKIPGCCACLICDCGQHFRIDLLSHKGMHACPKCRVEYTSVLIVANADDGAVLQEALNTVLESNGIRVPNPPGDDDDDDAGDELDDDDDDAGDDAGDAGDEDLEDPPGKDTQR